MIEKPDLFEADPPAQYDGQFLWDALDRECWYDGCRLMDFDAVLERRGRFLIFETKYGFRPGFLKHQYADPFHKGSLCVGQYRAFESLLKLRTPSGEPACTVIACAKRPELIDGFDVWTERGVQAYTTGMRGLIDGCAAWFERVSRPTGIPGLR